jgi:deoxyribodipyrimidine photo-lyase
MKTLFDDLDTTPSIELITNYEGILKKIANINPVQYAKTRNFINGAVTYLSSYISRGVISVKQVKDAVLDKGYKPYQVEKFLQELAWREYYQRIWQARGDLIFQDLKQPQPDVMHYDMISAIENASTGITAIDSHIKNFYVTGYLHNHLRMYIAAITCNIGKAHWLQPSRWMYFHLLDGDVASNNCSWQWVSGAFASKKYYCNQENINKYTFSNQRRSFLDHSYNDIPEIQIPEALKGRHNLILETKLPVTQLPVIDSALPTLIYNSYNLDPKWRCEEKANRILLLEPSHFQKYPVSEKVVQFIINLANNIEGVQLHCGELTDILKLYSKSSLKPSESIISKEHPAFLHYTGVKDSRDWIFPKVEGYYSSFFAYWKKAERYLS